MSEEKLHPIQITVNAEVSTALASLNNITQAMGQFNSLEKERLYNEDILHRSINQKDAIIAGLRKDLELAKLSSSSGLGQRVYEFLNNTKSIATSTQQDVIIYYARKYFLPSDFYRPGYSGVHDEKYVVEKSMPVPKLNEISLELLLAMHEYEKDLSVSRNIAAEIHRRVADETNVANKKAEDAKLEASIMDDIATQTRHIAKMKEIDRTCVTRPLVIVEDVPVQLETRVLTKSETKIARNKMADYISGRITGENVSSYPNLLSEALIDQGIPLIPTYSTDQRKLNFFVTVSVGNKEYTAKAASKSAAKSDAARGMIKKLCGLDV